jgi:hypothetical protein
LAARATLMEEAEAPVRRAGPAARAWDTPHTASVAIISLDRFMMVLDFRKKRA